MSQTQTNNDNSKVNNCYPSYSKQRFKMGRGRGRYYYNRPRFHYYNSFQPWNYFWQQNHPFKRKPNRTPEKEPPRPPSPFSGTEEYTLKKIQEASDMIKKQLMMPPELDEINTNKTKSDIKADQTNESVNEKRGEKCESEKSLARGNKKTVQYNVEEIHKKIITHITNLSHGKKLNLITSNPSGYDIAIQQIQKQKRLELSKVLRDMCSNQTVENSDVINSIIPDIGIKLEDLPLEVIQELSSTLDLNVDDAFLQSGNDIVQNKTKSSEHEVSPTYPSLSDMQLDNSDKSNDLIQNQIKIEIDTVDEFACNYTQLENTCQVQVKTEFSELDNFIPSYPVLSQAQPNEIVDSSRNVSFIDDISNNIEDKMVGALENSTNILTTVDSMETNSVHVQTDQVAIITNSTQTDLNLDKFQINEEVDDLEGAIQSMLEIDHEIERLTKLRQSIFQKLHTKSVNNSIKTDEEFPKSPEHVENRRKRKSRSPEQTRKKFKISSDANDGASVPQQEPDWYKQALDFGNISEKILLIQMVQETILAASESGKLFFINSKDGATLHVMNVTENVPITSICAWTTKRKLHLYVGSFEMSLREYNFDTKALIKLIKVSESVQCLELEWNYLFIGTNNGNLMRYNLKFNRFEFESNISKNTILVLKATREGARRVLLVGTRRSAVCVRDAMSGLRLRTVSEIISPTVYSLLLENNLVYCGTPTQNILVFSFHDGRLVHKYQASNSKGISCIRIVGNLLFASSHNGNIYVYNAKTHQYIGTIPGPGGVILSMEILRNIVIVGTMSLKFKSIVIPEHILRNNRSEFIS